MELTLKEIEINKLNLTPQDILIVKLKGSTFSEEFVESFGKHLKESFPNNKIELLLLPEDHDIVFEKVAQIERESND